MPAQDVINALARSCDVSSAEMTERLNLIVDISSNLLEYVSVTNVNNNNAKNLRWKTQSRSLEDLVAAVNTEIARISSILTK
uniref:COMM domain-containing protein n=1 Tax=Steinernema glaseri TaxID=37863 RepID=A0A1I8AJ36_9BILA